MATQLGGLAKLAWRGEATWGTDRVSNAASSSLLYFDSFVPENARTPIDFTEINSSTPVDHSEFVEGGIIVGGTVVFTQRYTGSHAALNGLALGVLTTTGSNPYLHTATMGTQGALNSISIRWMPPNDVAGANDYDDHTFTGLKVASCTWSHRSGEPMKCSITFIGRDHAYDTTPLDPTSSMHTPTEDIVQWHDKEAESGSDTGFELELQTSGTFFEPKCTSWDLTIDNGLTRRFIIQTGRRTAEPVIDGKRTVTLSMEIDKDEAWRGFQDAMGADSDTDGEFVDVRLRYEDLSNANLLWEALVANCRVQTLPAQVNDDGLLVVPVTMRAHNQSGAPNQALPLSVLIQNEDEGPGGGQTQWDDEWSV